MAAIGHYENTIFCFSRYMHVQYLNSNWNWYVEFISDIVLMIRGHLHLYRSC